jgi:hypothetical protein
MIKTCLQFLPGMTTLPILSSCKMYKVGDNLPSLTITPVKTEIKTEIKTEPISNMEYTELMDINPGDFKLDYDLTSGDFIDQLYADVCL